MNERDKYIGIFDSGIGGLTVIKEIRSFLPHENILFFGDTAHLPYGSKSQNQIIEYAFNDLAFLAKYNCKAYVIACNTADSVAFNELEKVYEPIFGVVKPACKRAVALSNNHNYGVIATEATIRSNRYAETITELDPFASIYSLACPLLVPLVENRRYRKNDPLVHMVLEEYLSYFKDKNIDTLVLGCTHYPLLEDAIKSLMKNVNLVSSSYAAAFELCEELKKINLLNESEKDGDELFFVSDDPENFKKNADLFLGDYFNGKVTKVDI